MTAWQPFVPDKHTKISPEQSVINWPVRVWRSCCESGKRQNNGLLTDTLFFSPPLVSALCSSHSLHSSHASCKMPCSPCLAHRAPVMQIEAMFIDVSIPSIDKFRKTAVQFQILLFFQTTGLLPRLFLVYKRPYPASVGLPLLLFQL